MRVRDIRALTFDCYGTLIDWESGLLSLLRPWAGRHQLDVPDDRLLESHARAEAACESRYATERYADILRRVHGLIAEEYGVADDPRDADAYAHSVGEWPPFPDTAAALQELKRRFVLVVVSNVDRASFAHTNQRLGVEFDALVLAEDVGAYKPDPRMFLSAMAVLEKMGIARGEILHVAQSLYHDHLPARAIGLATAWVDRRRGRDGHGATLPPASSVRPDLIVTSLAELVDLLG